MVAGAVEAHELGGGRVERLQPHRGRVEAVRPRRRGTAPARLGTTAGRAPSGGSRLGTSRPSATSQPVGQVEHVEHAGESRSRSSPPSRGDRLALCRREARHVATNWSAKSSSARSRSSATVAPIRRSVLARPRDAAARLGELRVDRRRAPHRTPPRAPQRDGRVHPRRPELGLCASRSPRHHVPVLLAVPRVRGDTLPPAAPASGSAGRGSWAAPPRSARSAARAKCGSRSWQKSSSACGRELGPVLEHDDDHHLLLAQLGGNPDRGRLGHGLVVVDHLLDLPRGDVLAAPADRVLEPVDEGEPAVLVRPDRGRRCGTRGSGTPPASPRAPRSTPRTMTCGSRGRTTISPSTPGGTGLSSSSWISTS